MIKILRSVVGPLESNSFSVYDDESEKSLIIDLGGHLSEIERSFTVMKSKPSALLLTHGHFDHTLGAADAVRAGIPVYISEKDSFMLASANDSLASHFGFAFEPTDKYDFLCEGVYEIGGFSVRVIETPGHTAGSLSFIIGDFLFAGDTVFKNGYGRYDLPTGDLDQLKKSFKKLYGFSGLTVCCGHGDETDLDEEKKHNPLFIL